jgi:hypothetical protein
MAVLVGGVSMHLTGLDLFFWAASFLGHLLLLFVLWKRHRATLFPFFTTLISTNILRTIALYMVVRHGTKDNYFYTYWSLALLDTILQLCIAYEMASHVFRPMGVWASDVRKSFFWLLGLSVFLACGLGWLASPPTRSVVQALVIKTNLFAAAWMSELFVGMMTLSRRVNRPWNTHVAAIAKGFGVYSLVNVVIETGHTYFGVRQSTHAYTALSHLRIAVYLGCVMYWIGALWRDAPPSQQLTEKMRAQLFTLQRKVEYDLQSLRSRREL